MKTVYTLIVIFITLNLLSAQKATFHPQRLIAVVKSNAEIISSSNTINISDTNIERLNEIYLLEKIQPLVKSKPITPKINRPATERLVLLEFQEAIHIEEAIKAYLETGLFDAIEPDHIGHGAGVAALTPNDAFFYNRQWGLYNDGTFNADAVDDADVDMEEAWEITTGNPETIIAILDSGFKMDHPELEGRFWVNGQDTPNDSIDNDNNGFADDVSGWDFTNNDNDPTDDHGHGTNVAGIMAATGNNEIGYAGIDWQAQVMVGKILDENNSGFYSNWIQAIYYAVDNGAQVINMSVGGSGYSFPMEEACGYARDNDAAIFVSMMNTNNGTSFYPAAYASTIAIGATDTNDERVDPFFWSATSGSNYGSHHDLCAPGNFMYGLSSNSDTNYNGYWGGTSQATPIVAGVASLMKGLDPDLTVEEIRSILHSTAEDEVGDPSEDVAGWDQYYGAGRLNAFAALQAVTGVVAVDDLKSDKQTISIAPNPIFQNEDIQLVFDKAPDQDLSFSIFDTQGKLIYSNVVPALTTTFTLRAPSESGIYFLHISTRKNSKEVLPILVLAR